MTQMPNVKWKSSEVIKNNMLHQPRSSSQMSPAPSTQHVVWQELWIVKKKRTKKAMISGHKAATIKMPSSHQSIKLKIVLFLNIQLYFLVANLKKIFMLLFNTKTIHHFSRKNHHLKQPSTLYRPVNATPVLPREAGWVQAKVPLWVGRSQVATDWALANPGALYTEDERLVFAWRFGFFMRISPPNSLEVWMVRRSCS